MKKHQKPLSALSGEISNQFLRGAISAGLLVAVQQQGMKTSAARKQVLARALQGGAALAGAVVAADALQRSRAGQAVLAVALGAAGMVGIEYVLKRSLCEKGNE